MSRTLRTCLVALTLQLPLALGAHGARAEGLPERAIALMRERCFSCHGTDEPIEGGLLLASRTAALAGGESKRPALVPGEPDRSLLYRVAAGLEPKLAMPPDEADRLSAAELETLRSWIAAGAHWPAAAQDGKWQDANSNEGVEVATSGGLSESWTHRKYRPEDIWAWQPLAHPHVPSRGLDAAAITTPIDAFIQARLHSHKLAPAPAADKAVWLRRATFDLTGLPPTPAELAAFVADQSPTAYDKVIDRLLASPHYGEQMARHWLDVVRYADTSGYSNDYERPHAWRYRDYVVRSFNADKPFDRFTVEQLAGDEFDANDPELLVAVGFLRMGPWEHTAMSVAIETRQQFLDDVTHSVGVTFLGQGLRCARCHDHKFDPIPTQDYYRLQAVFAPVQFRDREVAFLPSERTDALQRDRPRSERLLAEARSFLAGLDRKHEAAVKIWLAEHDKKTLDEVPASERPPRHLGLTTLDMSLEKVYQKRADYYELELRRYEPQALSVYDGPNVPFDMRRGQPQKQKAPRETKPEVQVVHLLKGGALDSPGEAMRPGVLSAAHWTSESAETLPEATTGRRLALARWIASPQNPLTARVIVNRVWQMHFGRGLVATSNSFGRMGAKPTHPELLDWLAERFVAGGWRIKDLHRLILRSHVYRQSNEPVDVARAHEIDPGNKLLASFPARRLAAEEIRDALLATSGELVTTVGGPPVYPDIHPEVALQPRHIMGSVAPAYQASPRPEDRHRRTLYAYRCRTLADPLLEVLNKPGSDLSCERRDETIVAPQALAMLNDQATHDRALGLALRLAREAKTPRERVAQAFRLVYARSPSDAETSAALAHVERQTKLHTEHPPRRVEPPRVVRREMIEELTGEVFSWDERLDLAGETVADPKPWDVDAATRAWADLCLVMFNSNEFLVLR